MYLWKYTDYKLLPNSVVMLLLSLSKQYVITYFYLPGTEYGRLCINEGDINLSCHISLKWKRLVVVVVVRGNAALHFVQLKVFNSCNTNLTNLGRWREGRCLPLDGGGEQYYTSTGTLSRGAGRAEDLRIPWALTFPPIFYSLLGRR